MLIIDHTKAIGKTSECVTINSRISLSLHVVYIFIYICTTFTPKIKGKSQCKDSILHWFCNINKILNCTL